MKAIVLCSLLLLSLVSVSAVSGNKGACQTGNYTDVNVNWDSYLGKWYNVRVSSNFNYQDPSDQCTVANYSLNSDGTVRVDNSAVKANGKIDQAIGTATIYGPGHLKVWFSAFQPIKANYEIVYMSEDQQIVSVVGCNGYGIFGSSLVWILSRSPYTSQTEINEAVAITQTLGFDVSDLIVNGVSQCNRI